MKKGKQALGYLLSLIHISIYEPLFSDDSFGYRPGRGAKDAIYRIKEYIEQGYILSLIHI